MKRWIPLLGVAALAIGALGAVAAVGLNDSAPRQDGPGDVGDAGGVGSSPGSSAGSSAVCAPGYPDCNDTIVVGGKPGESPDEPGSNLVPPRRPLPVDPKPVDPRPDAGGVLREAPIDALELLIKESYPVQYALQIASGLPNGCTEFHGIRWDREGNVIKVLVLNEVHDGGGTLACDMSYGTVENTVELGTDFEPGETYLIVVNGKELSFLAQ